MSTFDPDVFMNQNVDQPMATDWQLVPEGHYQATVDDFDSSERFFASGEKDGRKWVRFNCPFSVTDQNLLHNMGRDKVTVRANWFLDFDGDGKLATDPDRNVMLGRLRYSLGQNTSPWNFSMLRGAGPVMIQVRHRADTRDPTRKYAEVANVAPVR